MIKSILLIFNLITSLFANTFNLNNINHLIFNNQIKIYSQKNNYLKNNFVFPTFLLIDYNTFLNKVFIEIDLLWLNKWFDILQIPDYYKNHLNDIKLENNSINFYYDNELVKTYLTKDFIDPFINISKNYFFDQKTTNNLIDNNLKNDDIIRLFKLDPRFEYKYKITKNEKYYNCDIFLVNNINYFITVIINIKLENTNNSIIFYSFILINISLILIYSINKCINRKKKLK